mmetsp:Transcript_3744/g.7020  ORF Transcript_3744/g.7020 Transcript_3744/m.7020 type:complete len:252 (-) Transcript_3744:136-891(-)
MLQVLKRFGGHAESSDDGRLVYVFPHLQVTALQQPSQDPNDSSSVTGGGGEASTSGAAHQRGATPLLVAAPVAPPIYERKWKCLPGGPNEKYVIGLGVANLLLIILFRNIGGLELDFDKLSEKPNSLDSIGRKGRMGIRNPHLSHMQQRDHRPRNSESEGILLAIMLLSYIPKFVAWAFPVLFTYALAFFLIPGTRALWILLWTNPRISKRNELRHKRVAELVKDAVSSAVEKGSQAKKHQAMHLISPSEV